jgi:quercetin dioxygenase-like cupin family protein
MINVAIKMEWFGVQAIYELEPCGVISPHTHPGGTESLFVFDGNVSIGFVDGPRVLESDVSARQGFQVPQGTTHDPL